MYAVYHGQMDSKELPRMSTLTVILAEGLALGTASVQKFFDTVRVELVRIQESELSRNSRSFSGVHYLRTLDASAIGITLMKQLQSRTCWTSGRFLCGRDLPLL